MTTTIPVIPDEETPLLGGQQVPALEVITESESEAATLAGSPNQGSRTQSVGGKTNANGGSEVVKKTPLPWAQFSIVIFLQLAEPLTSQVIYPVSLLFTWFFSSSFCPAPGLHRPKGFVMTEC